MSKKKKRNSLLNCARQMPELKHSTESDFDITKSEVVQWLIRQPNVLQYLFDRIRASADKSIVYNQATGTWRGIDNNS